MTAHDSCIRVVIHCRTSSNRLPAKALLPVRELPSIVLCARRAANTGLSVVVATSNELDDDVLADTLKRFSIPVYRGSLTNVLARVTEAIGTADNNDLVVRLTGDNLFVDGALIEELGAAFRERRDGYLSLHPASLTGLPYGLSAEITTVGALRQSVVSATTTEELEHVTVCVRRRFGVKTWRPREAVGRRDHLRATLDSWTDYQRITRSFAGVQDPVGVSWVELCERLAGLPESPAQGLPKRYSIKGEIAELSLGTAQLGMRYGIANRTGQPSRDQARQIVLAGVAHGLTHIDTAQAYGEAETRLGEILDGPLLAQVTVATKLSPLPDLDEASPECVVIRAVEASVFGSCRRLRQSCLHYLLLHRWRHRTSHGGVVWTTLKRLQAEGAIGRLGASVQDPEEAIQAVVDPDICMVQLPFNVLDRRFQAAGVPEAAARRADLIIQARSIFLQGLLLSSHERWPKVGVDSHSVLARLSDLTEAFGRRSVADLCVAYVRAQSWIDSSVIGIESIEQLKHNVDLFAFEPLTQKQTVTVEATFPELPSALLDPSQWTRPS